MLFTCLSFLSYSLSFDKPAFCLLHMRADYDKQCKKKTLCRCPFQSSIGSQVVSHDARYRDKIEAGKRKNVCLLNWSQLWSTKSTCPCSWVATQCLLWIDVVQFHGVMWTTDIFGRAWLHGMFSFLVRAQSWSYHFLI